MRTKFVKGVLLVGMAILVGVACAAGYWYVQSHGAVDASVAVPHGDAAHQEAVDARIGSTSDGAQHESGDDIQDDPAASEEYNNVRHSVEGLTADDARNFLESQLESSRIAEGERAQLEASLGLALLDARVPDTEAARTAFARAFKLCEGANARVRLAHAYAELLYERGHYDATLELLNAGRFVGAQFSPERLAIEAIRGLTLEALGRGPAAQDAYERALESALASELHDSARGRDAARLIGLRLARSYRDAGRDEDAVAISRMLRAWLGEDDLVRR